MKNLFRSLSGAILIAAALLLFFFLQGAFAQSWLKVVDKGFGNPKNDYAWNMVTFKGKLYVGTLNHLGGAEIWCSDSGEVGTWQKVYDDRPLANRGIRCFYADGDRALYASTFHINGAQILRSTDGRRWITIRRRGFGNPRNQSIRCMIRFGEYLYAGVGSNGAELYRSENGWEWEKVNTIPRFASTKVLDPQKGIFVTNNRMIGELAVFKNHLYAFTWVVDADIQNMRSFMDWTSGDEDQDSGKYQIPDAPGAFEVWRSSNGINWEKVVGQDDSYGNGMGFSLHDPENLSNDNALSVTVFQGHLYLGTVHIYGKSSIWRTSEGTQWEKVLDFYDVGEEFNYYVWRLWSFKDKLYVGTLNMGSVGDPGVTGAQIWVSHSGEVGTFYPLVLNGFDGETVTITEDLELPKNYGIRSIGILNDTLFVGTATVPGFLVSNNDRRLRRTLVARDVGCEIWKMIPEDGHLSAEDHQNTLFPKLKLLYDYRRFKDFN